MKIKPENEAEKDWVRETATTEYALTSIIPIVDACRAWVEKHPKRPGPGSVLLWNRPGSNRIRIVREDGGLMDPSGFINRSTADWKISDTDRYGYTVLFDSGEAK